MATPVHSPTRRTGERATRVRWSVVCALFLVAFLTIVDRVCISSAKNDMARDLSLTDVQFGLVFGVFTIGYAILMVPSGWWADRYGPRRFMALIVLLWSLFTALTGLVRGLAVLVTIRFLFGLAEAGAFPTAARAIYNWLPMRERGLALGLLNTGSRMGAAIGLAVMALSVVHLGWRLSFLLLGVVGFGWVAFWYAWYRDDPSEKRGVSASELALIRSDAAPRPVRAGNRIGWRAFLKSPNVYLILTQYFASNFTFFICFSWLLPYLKNQYGLTTSQAGAYASIPLYCGALATWTSGYTVDWIFRKGRWRLSRALPPSVGFGIAAVSVIAAAWAGSAGEFVFWFALATFGVDLTLSPSWTVCSDVGGEYTGTLSGAMNTMGSLGSFTSSVAFPLLIQWTGSVKTYFYVAALLNVAAAACWWGVRPERRLE